MFGCDDQVGGDLLSGILNQPIVEFCCSRRLVFLLFTLCNLISQVLERGCESRLLGSARVIFLIEFGSNVVGGEGFVRSSVFGLEAYGQNTSYSRERGGFCRSLAHLNAGLHRYRWRGLGVGGDLAANQRIGKRVFAAQARVISDQERFERRC